MKRKASIADLTAHIVAGYVSNNSIGSTDLSKIICDVHRALVQSSQRDTEEPVEQPIPAVPVRTSVRPDAIACLECGRKFKSLKRHIQSVHDLTPAEYRVRWNLSNDYAMVAPEYAAMRSEMAKKFGLGNKRA